MNNPFLGLYEVMAEATKVEASFFMAKIVSNAEKTFNFNFFGKYFVCFA